MSFENDIKEDIKNTDTSMKGDWFKVSEGDNRMRIISEPVKVVERFKYGICYEGAEYCKAEQLKEGEKLSIRYMSWILDKKDNEAKLFKMSYTVAKQIYEFMQDKNDGYGFEGFPMPYEINLKATGAGEKTVEYQVIPARKSTDLTPEEETIIGKLTPISQIIDKMKEKAKQKFENGGVAPEKKPFHYPTAEEEGINTAETFPEE